MEKINFDVIDQMYSAVLSANENESTIKALRPQVEEAVRELIRRRGLPTTYTGIIVPLIVSPGVCISGKLMRLVWLVSG